MQVGSIGGMLMSSSDVTVTAMNGSCTSCICIMLLAQNILGVSCSQNQTCLLFHNYSVPYTIDYSPSSSFHFLVLPPEQTDSTYTSTASTQMAMVTTQNISPPWTCANMTILIDYDMPGGDVASYSPLSIAECCTVCLNTTGCLGFVWGWPNNTDSFQVSRCWIKGTLVTPRTTTQFTSAHF